jgi:hypothetical protein
MSDGLGTQLGNAWVEMMNFIRTYPIFLQYMWLIHYYYPAMFFHYVLEYVYAYTTYLYILQPLVTGTWYLVFGIIYATIFLYVYFLICATVWSFIYYGGIRPLYRSLRYGWYLLFHVRDHRLRTLYTDSIHQFKDCWCYAKKWLRFWFYDAWLLEHKEGEHHG